MSYDPSYGMVLFLECYTFQIIGHGRFKLKLKDGRIRTLSGVLHIPNLARNLISAKIMDVAGVKTMCGDGVCKMV